MFSLHFAFISNYHLKNPKGTEWNFKSCSCCTSILYALSNKHVGTQLRPPYQKSLGSAPAKRVILKWGETMSRITTEGDNTLFILAAARETAITFLESKEKPHCGHISLDTMWFWAKLWHIWRRINGSVNLSVVIEEKCCVWCPISYCRVKRSMKI